MPKPVAWWRSSARKKSGRFAKLPRSTIVAPLTRQHRSLPSPNEWHIGSASTSTSSAVLPMKELMFEAEANMFAWERHTPFGSPVVPVVKSISATSSGDAPSPAGAAPADAAGRSISSNPSDLTSGET